MKSCDAMRNELKAFQDGELTGLRRWLVDRHVRRCASCREEAQIMKQIGNRLRDTNSASLKPELRAKILASLPSYVRSERPAPNNVRKGVPLFVALHWKELAAAAVVFTVAAMLSYPYVTERVAYAPPSSRAAYAPLRSASTGIQPGAVPRDNGEMPGMKVGTAQGPIYSASVERQVKKEASISVEVKDAEEKCGAIERMVKEAGGYVTSTQLSTDPVSEDTSDPALRQGPRSATMILKVPVTAFDSILTAIGKLGKVTAKNLTGEDITEQISDVEQERKVLAADIQEAQKAIHKNPDDYYANYEKSEAEREARIRLAQAQAKLELLKRTAAMSSITVQLSEPTPKPQTGGFLEDVGSPMGVFLTSVRLLWLCVAWIVASSPIWVPLALIYRQGARAYRRKAAARELREWQNRWNREGGKA